MSEVEIESGVEFQARRKRRSKYPLDEMDVGDSFVVEKPTIRPHLSRFMKADDAGRKFATRKTDDGGLRVWRVS